MNQSFEVKELKKFCKQGEYIGYDLTVAQLEQQLDDCWQNIIKEIFEFDIVEAGEYYFAKNLSNRLILRKLNDNIKRIYKDEQANRRIIISQLKVLLEETCPSWIIKTDIKSFYESIDREKLIAKFQDDSMLSYYSMFLLRKLFANSFISEKTGVPRGMNISATLSEIYMRKFDKWIRNAQGVYYYARFVDDIIIFTYSKEDALKLLQNIDSKLKDHANGLTINKRKTQLFNGLTIERLNVQDGSLLRKDNFIEYLGYKFWKTEAKKNNLKIGIAEKKIKKIKTRITLSFVDFIQNQDFKLLENRIKFLTGNYSIKKDDNGKDLRAGIYFNYPEITDLSIFTQLNEYFRKILFAKKRILGLKINHSLSIGEKKRLAKYCFLSGFKAKVYNSFSYAQMSDIISCWN
jgi:hypothetical protein